MEEILKLLMAQLVEIDLKFRRALLMLSEDRFALLVVQKETYIFGLAKLFRDRLSRAILSQKFKKHMKEEWARF